MDKLQLCSSFEEITLEEQYNTDGGVAPLLVFVGKAILSGGSFAAAYWGVDKIFD